MVEIYVMLQAKTVGAVSPSWGSTLSWGPADQAAKASLTNNGVSKSSGAPWANRHCVPPLSFFHYLNRWVSTLSGRSQTGEHRSHTTQTKTPLMAVKPPCYLPLTPHDDFRYIRTSVIV